MKIFAVEVILQKGKAGPCHGDHGRCSHPLPHLKGKEGDGDGCDRRNAGCQTVQAVDQVHRIHEADDPENGERQRYDLRQINNAEARHVDPFDIDIENDDGDGRSDDLPKSFTFGGREYTSSAMPTAIKNVAPTMMPTIS